MNHLLTFVDDATKAVVSEVDSGATPPYVPPLGERVVMMDNEGNAMPWVAAERYSVYNSYGLVHIFVALKPIS